MEIGNGNEIKLFGKTFKVDDYKAEIAAQDIMIFCDENSAAVSKKEFWQKLAKLKDFSNEELIKFMHGFDKDESILELICDEVGTTPYERKGACRRIFNLLESRAKSLCIDTKDFKNSFNSELNAQFDSLGSVDTEKLDDIVFALTQSIKNRQDFTKEDVKTIQKTSASEGQAKSNVLLENRLEKAYSSFGERVDENGNMSTKDKLGNYYDGQMQRDGWAGDTADCISKIWGSENTADKVRKDLKTAADQLRQLKETQAVDEDAFKFKFKEVFGVEYDYSNIYGYEKAEKLYLEAAPKSAVEEQFNRTTGRLLSSTPLVEEYKTMILNPSGGMPVQVLDATKQQVYDREYKNLAGAIGEKGSQIIDNVIERQGLKNAPIEKKFEVLKTIAKSCSQKLHDETLKAANGKEFLAVKEAYENSYKAAYGVDNNIMKRVTEYNNSQEIGAAVVKGATTLVATVATAATGVGVVATAGVAAGSTVVAEVSDRGTSGKALNALRDDGLAEWLQTTNNDVDWESTLKQAAISGGTVFIAGYVAKGVNVMMQGKAPITQAAAMFGADVATDAGLEYLTTGEITASGMVFSALLSGAGNIAALKQMGPLANAAQGADDAIDAAKAASNAADVLKTADDVIDVAKVASNTADVLKSADDVVDITSSNAKSNLSKLKKLKSSVVGYIDDFKFNHELGAYKSRAAKMRRVLDEDIIKATAKAGSEADIAKLKQNYYQVVDKLSDMKSFFEVDLFSADDIRTIMAKCSDVIESNPEKVMYILNDVNEWAVIAGDGKNAAPRAIKAILEPSQRLIDANPLLMLGDKSPAKIIKPQASSTPNPHNLSFVDTPDDVGKFAQQALASSDYRIATAGYSAAPDGYEIPTKKFMQALDSELGNKKTAYVTSPTADKGSIDAITTEIAGFDDGRLFYTTAKDYVEYINPDNFPAGFDKAKYANVPKYVLPDGASYSKATAEASNVFLATGGRNATVSDFVNALNKGNKTIVLDNTSLDVQAWDAAKNRVNNASKYLSDQIEAVKSGKPLPYPEIGEFTEDFIRSNLDKIESNMRIYQIDGTDASIAAAANESASFVKAQNSPLESVAVKAGDDDGAIALLKKATAKSGGVVSKTDFASQLAEVKGLDGQPFLSKSEIEILMRNNKGLSGKPIPNFEAKVKAILSNAEELDVISKWQSRAAGVWASLQEPFGSTIDMNPMAFLGDTSPKAMLKPQAADNIKGQGISFKQAAGQPDYSATRIEWGDTVEQTIALNKKNGVNLEFVKGDDGKYFLGIKDVWSDGYHRVDRNSVVMHYGDYVPEKTSANKDWVKAHANPDGTIKDCAVVANDTGAKILENSYVTADGQKIDFDTMAPGTRVHKDPDAIVNAVAFDAPKKLQTLEGSIETAVTMGDVDGNVYNNFKQLKKQILKGQLVADSANPYSQQFIYLVKAGDDRAAIELLKRATISVPILEKAGFTRDVIRQLRSDKLLRQSQQFENTMKMIKFLEDEIAQGEKISPKLIKQAIAACDGKYSQPGYGDIYQAQQIEVLNKYWARAEEARAAYRQQGLFFGEGHRLAVRQAVLDKAGFTEDIIDKMKKERFFTVNPKLQIEDTIKMVEYLEDQIAQGKQITPELIKKSVGTADGLYAQPGYGDIYQAQQIEALSKYWARAKDFNL